jgi:catechol 2,3-dioxygenase-like lactoylglutathione lyase family enzyme
MKTTVGALTLFVADKDRAQEFYARTFALEPVYEDASSVVFELENTLVNLLHEREAPELIEPAHVGTGTRAQYTIWVDDCDATVEQLRGRGVDFLNGPQDRPWGQRTAAFADPDAHVWEIAQHLNPSA